MYIYRYRHIFKIVTHHRPLQLSRPEEKARTETASTCMYTYTCTYMYMYVCDYSYIYMYIHLLQYLFAIMHMYLYAQSSTYILNIY